MKKKKGFFLISKMSVVKRTERNLDVINSLYNQGMDVAREAMPKLKEYLKLHIEKEKA